MCGGLLEVDFGSLTCTCSYCGSAQSLPKLDTDKKTELYIQANRYFLQNEFDSATMIYEQILLLDDFDAEAYWSLLLCRFGISYVTDPETHLKKPTVNRIQRKSILKDDLYLSSLKYASPGQLVIYKREAQIIHQIQCKYLEISTHETPFDIFISYKETDALNSRTQDSYIANDLYNRFTQLGYHVFFSKITLQNVLGQEYEPYIFSAITSSKVMLVIGTRPEFFSSVWVKNEWSRFLLSIKEGQKKVLIPLYKDMTIDELPGALSSLQALDISHNDSTMKLVNYINKLFGSQCTTNTIETIQTHPYDFLLNPQKKENTKDNKKCKNEENNDYFSKKIYPGIIDSKFETYDNKGIDALSKKHWKKAINNFEKIMNLYPNCPEAKVGLFMAAREMQHLSDLDRFFESKFTILSDTNMPSETVFSEDEHIEELKKWANNYVVPGFLSEEQIMSYLLYNDLSYKARTPYCMTAKENCMNILDSLLSVSDLQTFPRGQLISAFPNELCILNEIFDRKISLARESDEVKIQRIRKNYLYFLQNAEQRVLKQYQTSFIERDKLYWQAVAKFNSTLSKSELKSLKGKFAKLGDYKDSKGYYSLCDQRILRPSSPQYSSQPQRTYKSPNFTVNQNSYVGAPHQTPTGKIISHKNNSNKPGKTKIILLMVLLIVIILFLCCCVPYCSVLVKVLNNPEYQESILNDYYNTPDDTYLNWAEDYLSSVYSSDSQTSKASTNK